MNGETMLTIAGLALAGAIVYLGVELGKTRQTVDRVVESPTSRALLTLGGV